MYYISKGLFFSFSCFEWQLFNLSQGRWLWYQPTDAVTDQDNDSFQHLETVVCCYSCCIWRRFLDERSENCGAQQFFTRGILCHSFPLMWAFSLLLPFCCHFFHCVFCCATPSVCPVLVKSVCPFMAPSLPQLHPWHFPFSLQNHRMICKSESIHPEFLDVCQTIPGQQHDLLPAQISTVYTLLALLRKTAKAETDMEKISYPSTGY